MDKKDAWSSKGKVKSFDQGYLKMSSGIAAGVGVSSHVLSSKNIAPEFTKFAPPAMAYILSGVGLSVAIAQKKYNKFEKNINKGKLSPRERYVKAYAVANQTDGLNKSATFSVGRVGDSSNLSKLSASVLLKDGYDVDVNMVLKEDQYVNRALRHGSAATSRFYAMDHTAFRESNGYISGDVRERMSTYDEGDAAYNNFKYESQYADSHAKLLSELQANYKDPDFYMDVTGAPYYYNEHDNNLYPSTVRYSGESLKELVNMADDSSTLSSIGKGDAHMDIVDLAYAHGTHSEDVRKKKTKNTRPEYQIDDRNPEVLYSKANFRSLFVQWAHNTCPRLVEKYKEWTKKPGLLTSNMRSTLAQSELDMAEGLAALSEEEKPVEYGYNTTSNELAFSQDVESIAFEEDDVSVVLSQVPAVDGYNTDGYDEIELTEDEASNMDIMINTMDDLPVFEHTPVPLTEVEIQQQALRAHVKKAFAMSQQYVNDSVQAAHDTKSSITGTTRSFD